MVVEMAAAAADWVTVDLVAVAVVAVTAMVEVMVKEMVVEMAFAMRRIL